MFTEADRMRDIPFSGIRKMMETAAALEAAGTKITHMEIGRPDFDTPLHIKEAAIEGMRQGAVHYASNYGVPKLREAIAKKLQEENGISVESGEIIVTIGANEAIFIAMMAFLDRGDAVMIPEPSWTHYENCAKLAGAEVVSIPLTLDEGYRLTREHLERAYKPNCKMLIVNSPNNPTGVVIPPTTLVDIAAFAQEHNVLIVADEIYEKILYDGAVHQSIAALPGMKDYTITVNGFSKAYAMDGWRLGYLAAPKELIAAMIRVHQYSTVCACTFNQLGAVAAVEGPQDCVEEMTASFARRRTLVCRALDEMGLRYSRPDGAFYVFPDIRFTGMSSEEAAYYFLREAQVSTVPGNSFGSSGEGYLRMAFSSSEEELAQGLERLQAVVSSRFRVK